MNPDLKELKHRYGHRPEIAWLIAEVERLEAENKWLREENEHWHLRISQISEANEVLERTLRERPIIVRVPGSLIEGRK